MIITEEQRSGRRPGVADPVREAADFRTREEEEISLGDLLRPLIAKRKLISQWAVVGAMVATILFFVIPAQYSAVTRILPPQQAQNTAAAMLGQFGALAGLAGKDMGIKNPIDMYVGILKSRSIADAIIQKFELQRYYREKKLSGARKDLEKRTDIEAGKDGLITIRYENKNPERAAAIANAYVEQLYDANKRLAITEAAQRRLFFEKALETEKDQLANAEVELRKTQESTGLIQLNSQSEAIIRSVAQLQAQLAAKEVQLQSMRSFATSENPEVILLEQEISALHVQLAKVERDNKLGEGNIEIPTGKIPEAGLQYVRKLREVKYHEGLFEMLAKQFEAAKIDEGKSAPLVQVVDSAIPPDKRAGLTLLQTIVLGFFAGVFLGCLHTWYLNSRTAADGDGISQRRAVEL